MTGEKATADRVDIRAVDHGSIWLLHADTSNGQEWFDEHIDPDAMTFGGGIVVEPRYVKDILEGAHAAGLGVSIQ